MVRLPSLPALHRVVAALLAAAVLVTSLPAHAEETEAEIDHRMLGYSTLFLGGVTLVTGTIAGVSLARANSLYDERRELSIQLGGTGDVGKNDVACRTTEECARKATLRDDQASASALFTGALVGAAVAGALTVASGIAWFATAPEKKARSGARLVPSAGPTGGGLNVVGSF